jgi:uncharacterized protein YndB with AHSA1/START domain
MSVLDTNTTRVKRETELQAPPEEVWDALTDGPLTQWLGEEVKLEVLDGGAMRAQSEGETRIELTIEPGPQGTRLVVIEATSIGGPTESAINLAWHRRLTDLREACSTGPESAAA